MKPSIQLRLGQHLTMTPQLQQAIRLLQLSTLDLKQEIQEALESNLMLEVEEDETGELQEKSKSAGEQDSAAPLNGARNEREIDVETEVIPSELPVDSSWDDEFDIPVVRQSSQLSEDYDALAQQSQQPSLRDYLMWQLNLTPFSDQDRGIATAIIDGIDSSGYLTPELDEIIADMDHESIGMEEVIAVLHRVQRFDPPGVAARNPQECLLLQLEQLPRDTLLRTEAIKLLDKHFDLLTSNNETRIRRILKISGDQVQELMQLIRSLDPHPGESISPSETSYVEPDVFVRKLDDRWVVTLNPGTSPKLRVNADYASLVRRADSSADNTTLKDHLQEARWFIKSLQSRNETLLKVASTIVELQQGFFEHGDEAMKPLVLRTIAEALDMHESTISRVTSQKYMHTPRGTLEFKYFFSSHVSTSNGGDASATAIRALIKKLIAAEEAAKPLSDNKIATLLSDQGINVARRTVAKYREAMSIPPSNERKRLI